jgi:heme exporter protein C
VYAAIALVWRIKLCEILAMACAPIGAAFTVITLATGSIWGKPMWGTWWDWDPRLTTELILLFLYLGVMGLYHAIDDRRNAARAAGLLAIVGVALLPVIRYSVVWWNSLHQGQTIRMFGESSMDASMIAPLWWMVIGTKFWFAGSLLARARADNLRREAGKDWVRSWRRKTGALSYRDYVIAAYAVFAVVMLWDFLAPRLQHARRELRAAPPARGTAAPSAPSPNTELER